MDGPKTMGDVIRIIAKDHGEKALLNSNFTIAVFMDLAPKLAKEKELLRSFLSCNGAEIIIQAKNASHQEQKYCIDRIVQRMHDDQWISEQAARYACSEFYRGVTGQEWKFPTKPAHPIKQQSRDRSNVAPKPINTTPISVSRCIPKRISIIGIICLLIVVIGITASLGIRSAAEQKAITSYLDEADILASSSDYVAALAIIDKGLSEYPDSTDLLLIKDTYSTAIQEDIANIISEADVLGANQDYIGAISKINTGLDIYPESELLQGKNIEFTDALNDQVKVNTLAEAASFVDAGDFVSGIRLIAQAMETHGDDIDYKNAYSQYCDEYKANSISSADGFAVNGDYLGAIAVIKQASSEIGMTEGFAKSGIR